MADLQDDQRAFKFLGDARKAFYAHIRPEYVVLAEREEPIEWSEFENLTMNSYEAKILHKNLSDDALVKLFELCAKQTKPLSVYELPRHYNEAIEREIAPLLAERLKAYVEAKKECHGE